MSDYQFTAALNSATFPLATVFQKRSIVIAGMDNNLRAATAGTSGLEKDNNPSDLPQVLYCENVMPTNDGLMSVGFEEWESPVIGETQFDDVMYLRNSTEESWAFSPAKGKNYIIPVSTGGAWVSTTPIAYNTNEVSIAYVNGRTFVCYARTNIYEWDGVGLVVVPVTGLAVGSIRGICGSGNYMIAFTDVEIWWSSLTNPYDFDVALPTGSGRQIPVDLRGQITYLLSQPGGFLICAQYNTVSAIYTQNAATPWIFREVKNAGGLTNRKFISTDNNSGATYMWGTNGFQEVNLREATNIFPEITDFLGARIIEDFNSFNTTFVLTRLVDLLDVKISYISGRYLILSYGRVANAYEYCLVLDLSLKRWGKLKFAHVEAFPGPFTPRQNICLMRPDGSFVRAVLDLRATTDQGVLLLGKYQMKRGWNMCSEELSVEVLDELSNFTVQCLASYTGATIDQALGMILTTTTKGYRNFQGQIEGLNLSYLFKGTFELATVVIKATKGAKF